MRHREGLGIIFRVVFTALHSVHSGGRFLIHTVIIETEFLESLLSVSLNLDIRPPQMEVSYRVPNGLPRTGSD